MTLTVSHKVSKKRAATEVRPTRGSSPVLSPKPLTPRLVQVLRFIDEFLRQNSFAPSLPEISAGIGVTSHATAYQHVVELERRGLIVRNPKFKRSTELTAAGRKLVAVGQPVAATA